MDDNGIGFVVLSLSVPGVQIEPDTGVAVKLAHRAHEKLAKEVQRKPECYSGFSHLVLREALKRAHFDLAGPPCPNG